MASIQLTQVSTEVVGSGDSNVRLTQISVEVLASVSYGLVQVYGGNFQDCLANPIFNGYLEVKLLSDSQQVTIGNGEIYSGGKITIPLDNTGNVPSSPAYYLWANSALNPAGSRYTFNLFDNTGIQLWRHKLTGAIPDQSSYNLALLVRS